MKVRMLPLFLVALGMAALAAKSTYSQAFQGKGTTHEGTIVTVSGTSFTMKDTAGKQHDHTLAAKAKVLCDGKACRLTDLKAGMHVRVTVSTTNPREAIRVEADKLNKR
jgi:hypothetical protein